MGQVTRDAAWTPEELIAAKGELFKGIDSGVPGIQLHLDASVFTRLPVDPVPAGPPGRGVTVAPDGRPICGTMPICGTTADLRHDGARWHTTAGFASPRS